MASRHSILDLALPGCHCVWHGMCRTCAPAASGAGSGAILRCFRSSRFAPTPTAVPSSCVSRTLTQHASRCGLNGLMARHGIVRTQVRQEHTPARPQQLTAALRGQQEVCNDVQGSQAGVLTTGLFELSVGRQLNEDP